MKKPANTPVVPLLNPALPDYKRLVEPWSAGHFGSFALRVMGAELPDWAERHHLNVAAAMLLSTGDSRRDNDSGKQLDNYTPEFAQAVLAALGYPSETLWVTMPEKRGPQPLFLFSVTVAKAFRRVEKEQALLRYPRYPVPAPSTDPAPELTPLPAWPTPDQYLNTVAPEV